jgi:hypothetical protein
MKCCSGPATIQDPLLTSHTTRLCSSSEVDPLVELRLLECAQAGLVLSLGKGFSFDPRGSYLSEERSA